MKVALVVGVILLGGAGVGLALERNGFYPPIGEPAVAAGLYEVPFYLCPGVGEVGVLPVPLPGVGEVGVLPVPLPGVGSMGFFHGGDRVLVTGRSVNGEWLEVRAPYDVGARVWVEAHFVTEDASLEGVPEATCTKAPVAISTTTTTTPPLPETTSSSTSPPASSSTTEPTATTGTTEPPPTTGTTEPPPPADTEGPIINFFQADESDVWEDGVYCAAQLHTMQVGGVVSDASGVQSVWISWDVGLARGTRIAVEISENVYFATIGPFPDSTITGADAAIWLEIKAYDDTPEQNRTTVSSTSFTVLHDCVIG